MKTSRAKKTKPGFVVLNVLLEAKVMVFSALEERLAKGEDAAFKELEKAIAEGKLGLHKVTIGDISRPMRKRGKK